MRAFAHAPAAHALEHEDEPSPRSQRTTFDVAAIASVAGLGDSHGNVPLDSCIPVRTDQIAPYTISRDEIRVLLYVDGDASLTQIAEEIALPLPEAIAAFLGLLRQGLVAIHGDNPLSETFVQTIRVRADDGAGSNGTE